MQNKLKAFCLIAIAFSFVTACSLENKWVAKIDGDKITLGELNEYYYAQHKQSYNGASEEDIDMMAANQFASQQNPTLNKEIFLNRLIDSKLLYNKAVKDDFTKSDDIKTLLSLQKDNILAALYIEKKFKDQLEITPKEIDAEYKKLKRDKRYAAMPVQQLEQMINQQLVQQKLQVLLTQKVEELSGTYKMVKHPEFLEKSTDPKKDVVLEIGGDKLTVEQFNQIYYTQLQIALNGASKEEIDRLAKNPTNEMMATAFNKKQQLDQIAQQKIIAKEAEKEGIDKDSYTKALIKIQTESFISNFYITKKYKSSLMVSPEELNYVFNAYKDQLKGIPADQAEMIIKNQIIQQKMQMKVGEILTGLKESQKIEKNLEIFDEEKTAKLQAAEEKKEKEEAEASKKAE